MEAHDTMELTPGQAAIRYRNGLARLVLAAFIFTFVIARFW